MRKLLNLFEARLTDTDVEYEESADKVIATLKSYKSQSYTKLAQKLERIETLEEEIKTLKEEVKQDTRENVADLFDSADTINTRVVDTISFIFTLSKDPKPTVSPKYKDILAVLEKQLTPELIAVLEKLKNEMVTITQKAPSLKYSKKEELEEDLDDIGDFVSSWYRKFKNYISSWGVKYDSKLSALKHAAGVR